MTIFISNKITYFIFLKNKNPKPFQDIPYPELIEA